MTQSKIEKDGYGIRPTSERPAPFRPYPVVVGISEHGDLVYATQPSPNRTFNVLTPAGKAVALVYELREEKKISSADLAALLAVLEPIAFAESDALE